MGFFIMDLSDIIRREIYQVNEDYPKSWNAEEFKNLTSFAARKRYADEKLQKISSGTGRRVYIIDNDTVLKLALNKKGVDQNRVEADMGSKNWYDCITEVHDYHPEYLWIVSERAKKISPKRIKELTGYSLEDIGSFAEEVSHNAVGRGAYSRRSVDRDMYEKMWEDEFTYCMAQMIGDYGQMGGDYTRVSSYGEVNRDGEPQVVVLDYGLSQDVWSTHYTREDINYLDESFYEDELMNFVNPDDVKDGGYGGPAIELNYRKELEGDDIEDINEALNDYSDISTQSLNKFVKFVEGLNPTTIAIEDTPNGDKTTFHKIFMVLSQNIHKAIQLASDDRLFYEKLMAIQSYLKNSRMISEDLKYSHVDDATKDEYKIVSEDGTSKFMTDRGVEEDSSDKKQEFGCLMVNFTIPVWENIISKIQDKDVYEPEERFGIETEPHATILYGFHEEVTPEEVQEKLQGIDTPIEIKIKGISVFNNPDFDVLKFDVESPQLEEIRERVLDLPNSLTYTDYKPHITIAYLLRGRGAKYCIEFKEPITITTDNIIFSDNKRRHTAIDVSPETKVLAEDIERDVDLMVERIITKSELAEMVRRMDEANIMSLQDLPFKNEIQELGGQIFSVGGAVRDEFLGKDSKDLDILITGIPFDDLEKIVSKYGKVDAVGKSFGILKFVPEGSKDDIDIAIPRTERNTGDKHTDVEVTSDHNLSIEDDLLRRDFTINAIAKDIDGNIVDPYNGVQDLKDKTIKLVNPDAFSDDPLRMLRAVQFASRFEGFEIEDNTMQTIIDNASKIKNIAGERVLIELDKIVKKGNMRKGAQLLRDTRLFKNIFGFDLDQTLINRAPFEDVKTMGEFITLVLNATGKADELYKQNLHGDIPTVKEIKALQMGLNNEKDDPVSSRIIAHNMYMVAPHAFGSDILPQNIQKAIDELNSGKYPKSLKDLRVDGNDMMSLGLNGKEIGDTLKNLLIYIYADRIKNDKNELIDFVSKSKRTTESIIGEAYDMVSEILSEREMRYMPNAETVDVNKNCTLGGNPDGTSDACNQGEMKNLTTKKIEEEEEEVNSKRTFYMKGKEPVQVNESAPLYVTITDEIRNNVIELWKKLDQETKDKYKNVYFHIMDKEHIKSNSYYPIYNLMVKNGIIRKGDSDKIDVSEKLGYYRGLWKNIGDNKKSGYIRKLYDKAQNKGELSKREFDELDYFLRNGDTRYNRGELSKKYY